MARKQLVRKRIVKRFRKPQEPPPTMHFLSGSQEELMHLTVYACHVHSQVFETKQMLDITHFPVDCPYGLTAVATEPQREEWDTSLLEPVEKILSVICTYNRFEVIGKLLFSYDSRGTVWLEVYPPSAHERAEALLSLSEWLDGKVSEEEKRELLGLCD